MSEQIKPKSITIRFDEQMMAALQERMEYLRQRNPSMKINQTDAVRHAILYKGYKKGSKSNDND